MVCMIVYCGMFLLQTLRCLPKLLIVLLRENYNATCGCCQVEITFLSIFVTLCAEMCVENGSVYSESGQGVSCRAGGARVRAGGSMCNSGGAGVNFSSGSCSDSW